MVDTQSRREKFFFVEIKIGDKVKRKAFNTLLLAKATYTLAEIVYSTSSGLSEMSV